MLRGFIGTISALRGQTGGVVGALFVSSLCLGMVALSLPLYLKNIGASPTEIGLTLSMWGAGMLVFELFWGLIADRFGVPIPLIASRFLYGGVVLGFAFAGSIPEFATLYLLSSGMLVAGGPLGRSFLGVSVPADQRGVSLAFHQAAMQSGTAIGAVLAGLIADRFGLLAVFQGAFLFPLLSGLIVLYAFRGQYRLKLANVVARGETVAAVRPQSVNLTALVITSSVVTLMVVGVSGERAFLPLLSTAKLQLSATDAGVILSALTLTIGLLMIPCGQLSDRCGRKPVIFVGLLISTLGLLVYPIAHTFAVVVAAALIRGLGVALVWPSATALVADVTPRARQGLMMGIFGTFENVGYMSGPIIGGFIWSRSGIESLFGVLASLVALSALAALLLIHERRWRQLAGEPSLTATQPLDRSDDSTGCVAPNPPGKTTFTIHQ